MMEVLVVEDDRCLRETLSGILTDRGFVTGTADSVESACRLWENDPARVVLSDFEIRGGTGIDVIRYCRESGGREGRYFFLMTGRSDLFSREEDWRRLGIDDLWFKPLRLGEILTHVASILQNGPGFFRGKQL